MHISAEKLQPIYTKWAYNEIIRSIALNSNPNKTPLAVVDDFAADMDEASAEARSGEASFIFSVACDVALHVRDELSMKKADAILQSHKKMILETEKAYSMR